MIRRPPRSTRTDTLCPYTTLFRSLVDGGPRKLVHGVFGTVMRSSASLPDTPTLLPEVAERWSAQWGTEMTEAAAEALAAPPAMDLTLKDAGTTQTWAEPLGGTSLLPGHVRLNESMAVTKQGRASCRERG